MAEKIRVTTDELRKLQEEWLNLFGPIETGFAEMNELMDRLDQCFMGKPVEAVRSKQSIIQEQAADALEQLKTHLQKLTRMNQIYDQAEGENKNVITNN